MNVQEFFQEQWPTLAPRVSWWLARAGAPRADREDLVQETALGLYKMRERVDWQSPVDPLVYRIAMNAWRDQWRRRSSREVVAEIPEQTSTADTERTALAPIRVSEVAEVMATMRPSTVRTLQLAASRGEDARPPVPLSAAERVARMRARRALAKAVNAANACHRPSMVQGSLGASSVE